MQHAGDYETALPKVFHALDTLERDHDQVDVATAAIEWSLCKLEEAAWTRERIQTLLQQLLDAEGGGSA
jgi:hypothetical protein